MIPRIINQKIKQQLEKFPVIAITGPRQSGKTTLAKIIGKQFDYYNLEDLSIKKLVNNDPVSFINSVTQPSIIDEIQKAPELLSQIQVNVDKNKKNGLFIITGSESMLLSSKISQSLAGRVVNNILLPLSYQELKHQKLQASSLDEQILQGFYPRIYDGKLTRNDFYPEYINTYIEKDIRTMQNIGNLSLFEKFLQLLAGRVGQLLNLSSLSNDLGVSHATVEKWISLLEASYIAFRLPPYFANLGKRLIKSPKIYFYDTGILTYLLGINSSVELNRHFAYGSIYENFVISEIMKKIYNEKLLSKLYFYRDSNGVEVDLLIDAGVDKIGVEIKATETFSPNLVSGLIKLKSILPVNFAGTVFYKGEQTPMMSGFNLVNINNWNVLAKQIK